MKLRSITAAVLVTIALVGCGTTKQQTPSSYRFDYQTTQAAEGVIRAFDDGRRTIVQFVDLDEARPTFKDEDGQGIQEVELQGQYAVLPRKYQTLTVTTGNGAEVIYAYVGKSLEPQDNTAALVTTQAMPAPKSDTMESELARTQEVSNVLKTAARLVAPPSPNFTDGNSLSAELAWRVIPQVSMGTVSVVMLECDSEVDEGCWSIHLGMKST